MEKTQRLLCSLLGDETTKVQPHFDGFTLFFTLVYQLFFKHNCEKLV